jgi:cytochrome c-type biogenesis protein CcmF
MPWLVGTALIHSLAATDKRGLFKSWTLLLAILGFSLSMLGTFLVRSGVLVSVHSFAADPTRGAFILVFLGIVVGAALLLYAWRAPMLRSQAGFELGARESFLLFNNILLVIAAATVLGGTLAPLIADAAGLGTLSVGPPYFNPTFMLPMLPLMALLCVGIHSNWKRGRLSESKRTLLFTLGIAAVLGLAVVVGVYSDAQLLAIIGMVLGFWIVLSSLVDPIDRLRRKLSLSRSVLGMTCAHVAMGVFVISVTAVEAFTLEKDQALATGESIRLGEYEFRFDNLEPVQGPNYDGVRAQISVREDGEPIATLYPEKRRYWVQRSVMTEAGIENLRGTDLFVALGEDLGAGRWSVRAQVRPLINFMWLSAFLIAFGGALAASDRRYRTARTTSTEPAAVPGAAGEQAS